MEICLPVQNAAGALVDVVAYDPATPLRWRLERGETCILGWPAVHACEWGRQVGDGKEARTVYKPLRLFLSPASWLAACEAAEVLRDDGSITRGDMVGACVIAWADPVEVYDALCGCPDIVCETEQLRAQLEKTLAAAVTRVRPSFRLKVG